MITTCFRRRYYQLMLFRHTLRHMIDYAIDDAAATLDTLHAAAIADDTDALILRPDAFTPFTSLFRFRLLPPALPD